MRWLRSSLPHRARASAPSTGNCVGLCTVTTSVRSAAPPKKEEKVVDDSTLLLTTTSGVRSSTGGMSRCAGAAFAPMMPTGVIAERFPETVVTCTTHGQGFGGKTTLSLAWSVPSLHVPNTALLG